MPRANQVVVDRKLLLAELERVKARKLKEATKREVKELAKRVKERQRRVKDEVEYQERKLSDLREIRKLLDAGTPLPKRLKKTAREHFGYGFDTSEPDVPGYADVVEYDYDKATKVLKLSKEETIRIDGSEFERLL